MSPAFCLPVRRPLNAAASLLLAIATLTAIVVSAKVEDQAPGVTKPLYDFTGKLFKQINSNKSLSNVVFSPISIHKAFNMLLLGVDANSTTKKELLDVIGYGGLSDDKLRGYHKDYTRILSKFEKINNETERAIMRHKQDGKLDRFGLHGSDNPIIDLFNMVITKGDAKVLPKYRAAVERYYHSSVERVEDGIAKLLAKLDAWSKKAGFSQPILKKKELDDIDLAAILMSAIRVQAFWPETMREMHNQKGIFHKLGSFTSIQDGTTLHIDKSDPRSAYLELSDKDTGAPEAHKKLAKLKCKVVKLGLIGNLSFTIFEPLEYSTPSDDKLYTLVKELFAKSNSSKDEDEATNLARVLDLIDGREAHEVKFSLRMPKFKFEKEVELKDSLKEMGLRKAFSDNAEIRGLTGERLKVKSVIHQAMIEVNKRGIKAAGVTKIKLARLSGRGEPDPVKIHVYIKKPFMYLIRYEKIPLFVGQLTRLEGSTASTGDGSKHRHKPGDRCSDHPTLY